MSRMSTTECHSPGGSAAVARGFTLVELLVVVGILALLIAILVPSLAVARESAIKGVCQSNLHQVGAAIHCYASDNQGRIPFGPKAPPMMTATDFYPSTGAPTSLISLSNGSPVGAGLLLRKHLTNQPRALFCPGEDQPLEAEAELAKVGHKQAQCSYYYRHGSIARQFDDPTEPNPSSEHLQLSNLGKNRNNRQIRALAMDTQFPAPDGFATFGIYSRTHHRRRYVNMMFSDGHVLSRTNADERFTVDLDDYNALRNAFDRILAVLEAADRE